MKLIVKTFPPKSFETYKYQLGASFNDMDELIKNDLKDSLLNEQGWNCGYCQQRIKDQEKMKIEHHCEQSICNGQNGSQDRRLDYTNLMAVCLGKGGKELHCDSQKATFNTATGLPIEVSPWIKAHMDAIRYHSSGLLDSTNDRHSKEINVILNLNTPHLKENRRRLWIQLFKLSMKNGILIKDKLRRLTQPNSIKIGNKYPTELSGLYQYMLKKFC